MYNEPHYRYVVEGCDQHKPGSEHYEALVEAGIDPENNWRLIFSFLKEEDAVKCCEEENDRWGHIVKHRVRDTQDA